MNPYYIQFTKEMKKDYTLLVPTMLPMHFRLIISVLETYGYKAELLTESGPEIPETGLKYVHNDTCYPALLVIGQFIHALQSGRYDPHKTALLYFQTGGGCRASNYVSLLRKALKKAGYEYVPVVAMSFGAIEKHPGLRLDPPKIHGMMYAILYGDLLMTLVNQVRPYENHKGEAQALANRWCGMLAKEIGKGRRKNYKKIKENYRQILKDFAAIEVTPRPAVKVGVVGEIFVKFSPLGNNNLEQFLVNEGAETVVPGLADFLLYCF
ncbi:MAG: 2-hydroxyacyl-CoA dehydratase, partial [Clostridia bacterium]|nr:2-hydroxyacyl-CoA dehydratase [Clostridia bacterium]